MSGKDIFLERQKDRDLLVNEYLIPNGIHDEKIIRILRKIPRHYLIEKQYQHEAYEDHPVPIGFQQTISQPFIVAFMTQTLQLNGTERILEIGTGSGYQSAILAELCAQLYTIEILAFLSFQTQQKLRTLGYTNIQYKIGDGFYGWSEFAPFDCIILTAAPAQIPSILIQQLKDGGTMILPLGKEGQELMKVQKRGDDIFWESLMPVSFVNMTGRIQT